MEDRRFTYCTFGGEARVEGKSGSLSSMCNRKKRRSVKWKARLSSTPREQQDGEVVEVEIDILNGLCWG